MTDCDMYCLVLNHLNGRKNIMKINDVYIAGSNNEYKTRATKKDIIASNYGTTSSLRVPVEGKKTKTVVTVEKIGTYQQLVDYKKNQMAMGKRCRKPKLQQFTPHGRPQQTIKNKKVLMKEEKVDAAKKKRSLKKQKLNVMKESDSQYANSTDGNLERSDLELPDGETINPHNSTLNANSESSYATEPDKLSNEENQNNPQKVEGNDLELPDGETITPYNSILSTNSESSNPTESDKLKNPQDVKGNYLQLPDGENITPYNSTLSANSNLSNMTELDKLSNEENQNNPQKVEGNDLELPDGETITPYNSILSTNSESSNPTESDKLSIEKNRKNPQDFKDNDLELLNDETITQHDPALNANSESSNATYPKKQSTEKNENNPQKVSNDLELPDGETITAHDPALNANSESSNATNHKKQNFVVSNVPVHKKINLKSQEKHHDFMKEADNLRLLTLSLQEELTRARDQCKFQEASIKRLKEELNSKRNQENYVTKADLENAVKVLAEKIENVRDMFLVNQENLLQDRNEDASIPNRIDNHQARRSVVFRDYDFPDPDQQDMVEVLPNKKMQKKILVQAIRQKNMRQRVFKLVEGYWPDKAERAKLVFDTRKKGRKIKNKEVKDIMDLCLRCNRREINGSHQFTIDMKDVKAWISRKFTNNKFYEKKKKELRKG